MPPVDDQPNVNLLNRERAKADVSAHLMPQLVAIRSLVDYGSHLIERALAAEPQGVGNVIANGVFLKQVVAMADAVEVLLAEGSAYACHLPARGAFEASLYLDYLLEKDTERRALRFYVGDVRDQLTWARKAIPGTLESVAQEALERSIGAVGDRTDRETTARRALEERLAHLAKPNLKSIDEEFSARRGKAKFDPPWYSLDGIQSVRSLAKHLNRLAEYETFYSRGSQIMHAGTYRDHLNVLSGGEVAFIPIRHVSDMSALLRSVFTVTLASYSKVVETYLSEEAEAVRELYVRKWREPFIGMPNINVEYR